MARDAGAELVRRAALAEETAVDELDVNAVVLERLARIGDLDQLARGGVGISEAARLEPVAVEGFAAGASHHAVRPLRRQPFAGVPQRIFPRGAIALISPFLKI